MTDAYILVIPAPAPWINANDREHYHAKAALTKAWRARAAWVATQARIPRIDVPVSIEAIVHKSNRVRFDPPNLYPTIKAAIDGLVRHPKHGGADVLADDDSEHVTRLCISKGEPDEHGSRLVLIIRKAAKEAAS